MSYFDKLSGKVKLGLKLMLVGIITLCIPGLNLVIYLMVLLPIGASLGFKMHNENNGLSLAAAGLIYLLLWFLVGYIFGKNTKNSYETKN